MLQNIRNFAYKNKVLIIFSFLLSFTVYGLKIFNVNYGMDTLQLMSNFNFTMNHWVSIGRPGMLIFKKLLFGQYTNVYTLNILGIFFMTVSSVAICYLCFISLEEYFPKWKIFIIPSLFISSPLWPQQYYFVLQNFEFSFCMFLIILSVILIYKPQKFSINFLLAIVLITLAFSVYQSFTIFFVTMASFLMLLLIYKNQKRGYTYSKALLLKTALRFITAFIISFLSYTVFKDFALYHYRVIESSYLKNQILWGRFPLNQIFSSMLRGLKLIILPDQGNLAFSYLFLIGCISLIITFIYQCYCKRTSKFIFVLVSLIFLFSGISMIFIYGEAPTIRSLVPSYSMVCAGTIFISSLYYNKKSVGLGIFLLVVLYSFKQINLTSNLLISDQIRFEEDNQKIELITAKIDALGLNNIQNYKVMMVGFWPSESSLVQQNEMIGSSLFQFGDFTGDSYATSQNVITLMRTRGIIYQYMTHAEYKKVLPLTENMKKFPSKNSVEVVGKIIIIKLS